MRQWVKTAVAVVASVATLVGAAGAHYLYSAERFAPGADGQWLTDQYSFSWRLNGWTAQTDAEGTAWSLTPGAVYVVASVSVRSPGVPPEVAYCSLRLIGRGGAEWSPEPASDTASGLCKEASASPGEAVDGSVRFMVPEVWATGEQLAGLAFAYRTGFAPTPMLTTRNAP